MTDLEKYFSRVYDKLVTGEFHIETLEQSDPNLEKYSKMYIEYLSDPKNKYDLDALYRFVVIQLDYYTFSNIGNVFIPDSDYDFAAYLLKQNGIAIPTTTTFSPATKTWQLKEHSAPQMVGSVEKVFLVEDVEDFIKKEASGRFGTTTITFAPKFDGVGINIEYDPKVSDFVSALTRKDGRFGQEIIKVIKNCENYAELLMLAVNHFGDAHGYIKGEILLSQKNFDELIKEKPYKNRRNAVSGLINTPTNLPLTKYLHVMPLAYATEKSRKKWSYDYNPEGAISAPAELILANPGFTMKYICEILRNTHDAGYEYRTDGVVVYVSNIHMQYNNIMDHAVAYKTNSKTGITTIEYGYISIGRTGKATPMLKVIPCDVNETVVTDVSLSNFAKVAKLGLHEHDKIAIESSGDVIPMVKEIISQGSPDPLKFDLKCPLCERRLSLTTSKDGIDEYACTNPDCPRIIVGNVANFFSKLGANGISDALILDVYEKLGLKYIEDFLHTERYQDELSQLPGWGIQSAANFCDEIERIKTKTITHGEFIGALGIPLISTKKCKTLFATINYDEFMEYLDKRDYEHASDLLYDVKGIAVKSADAIMDFFDKHYDSIKKIQKMFTNITDDTIIDANVVFTGFRDANAADKLDAAGIEVSDNINGRTIAVISANMASGKTQKAVKMGIPVYDAFNLDAAIDRIIENRM